MPSALSLAAKVVLVVLDGMAAFDVVGNDPPVLPVM